MKPYTLSIDIGVPRDLVIELFDDPDNLQMWQPGLQSWSLTKGDQGQVGAEATIVFLNGAQPIEMTERITSRNLPDELSSMYVWGGNSNAVMNRFIELGPEQTRWEVDSAYPQSSLKMKLMGMIMGSKFKAQHQIFMQAFKAFCEDGIDVRTGEA